MKERTLDPPRFRLSEPPTGDDVRGARKSRRSVRILGDVAAPVAHADGAHDLPDLDREPALASPPGGLDVLADVEITASDDVEVAVLVGDAAFTAATTRSDDGSLHGMRVVRRRIRKVGSDGPSLPFGEGSSSPIPPAASAPSPMALPVLTEVPTSPAIEERVVPLEPPAARPSRPPPPRPPPKPSKPPTLAPAAPSIFSAPTLPPIPAATPTRAQKPAASAGHGEDDVVLSVEDDEIQVGRLSDPAFALLGDLASLPVGPDALGKPSSKQPPPPPDAPRLKPGAPPPPPSRAAAVTVPEQRRRRRHWWEDLFNDDYLRTVPRLDEKQVAVESDWVEHALGVEAGAAVLDLACGTGRHSLELARRGYDVTGVDLSPTMVQRAQTFALGAPRQPVFALGDMQAIEYEECFDAAYCIGSSFGFFDDARNADVATRVHRSLKDNGTFLLQVVNRDHAIQSQPAMAWFEGDGCVCMEESAVNYITSRLNVKRTVIFDDGRQREVEYSVRLYSLHELGELLHESGFRILEVSGHLRTPGAFFGPSSRELIILAQKRGAEVVELRDPDHSGDD